MKEQEIMAVGVTVKPEKCGNEVECDISGQHVLDDAIVLSMDRKFTINFVLDDDSDWSWNVDDPFCARVGKCPRIGDPQHGLLRVTGTPTAKSFTVEAQKTGAKRIFHYRLNFANGETCDPIIIRD